MERNNTANPRVTASVWPNDFFTVLCKVSAANKAAMCFSQAKATSMIRGHYHTDVGGPYGQLKVQLLPMLKSDLQLSKLGATVCVYRPKTTTNPFQSTGDTIAQVERITHTVRKAAKLCGLKEANGVSEFIAGLHRGTPMVVVVSHPLNGFHIMLNRAAEIKILTL